MNLVKVEANTNVAIENMSKAELLDLVKDTQNILISVIPALSEILATTEEFQMVMEKDLDAEDIRNARDTLFMNMYSAPQAFEVQEELLVLTTAYGVLDEE